MDAVWFGVKIFFGLALGAFLLWLSVIVIAYVGAAVGAIGVALMGNNKRPALTASNPARNPHVWKRAGWCADCGILAENDVGELWHGFIREAGVCRECQEYRLIRAARSKSPGTDASGGSQERV